jgi:CTP:molybdopterin cytidylyltransferase MocA
MVNRSDISAIVLAAGHSSRMKRFKPLLTLGRQQVVERTTAVFKDAGIEDVMVVVGHRAADLRRALSTLDVRPVENPDYRDGMFSSVLAGVRSLSSLCRAFFIHPVDIPLVRPQTVVRLAEAFVPGQTTVVYPVFEGKRGHPTLIGTELVARLMEWSGSGGLRSFLRDYDQSCVDVVVADEAVGLDMDTTDDYRLMLDRLKHEGMPSIAECRVMTDEIQSLPPTVKAHCRKVASVARCLALALREAAAPIQVDQVYTAALLHDIARMEKDHAAAGARLLERHGFFRIAPIVAAHMDLDAANGDFKYAAPKDSDHIDSDQIDAAQVVYLADKLVEGNRPVSLEERFARAKKKFSGDPSVLDAIDRRLDAARRIQMRVEKITGFPIHVLIKEAGEEETDEPQ